MLNSVISKNNAIETYGLTESIELSSKDNSFFQISQFQSILDQTSQEITNTSNTKKSNNPKNQKSHIISENEVQNKSNLDNQNQQEINIIEDKNTQKSKQTVNNTSIDTKTSKTKKLPITTNNLNSNNINQYQKITDFSNQIINSNFKELTKNKIEQLNLKEIQFSSKTINPTNNSITNLPELKIDTTNKNLTLNQKNLTKTITQPEQETKQKVILNENKAYIKNNNKENKNNIQNPQNIIYTPKELSILTEITNKSNNIKNTNDITYTQNNTNKSQLIDNISLMNNNQPKNNANNSIKQEFNANNSHKKIAKTAIFKNDKHLQKYIGNIPNTSMNNLITTNISRTYELKSPLQPEEIAKELTKITKNIIDNNIYTARIILKPESLGTLFVKIQLISNKVNIKIDVEQMEVLKNLESQTPALKEALEKVGLKTEEINYRLKENLEDNYQSFDQNKRQKYKENKFKKNF